MLKETVALGGMAATTAIALSAEQTAPTLDQAFEALRHYQIGSSRAALLPIDAAVRAALDHTAQCQALEKRLVALLQTKVAPVAMEYICSKLELCGSVVAIPTLKLLLANPDLAPLARATLEALPYPETIPALCDSVAALSGMAKIGVIHALGMRRAARSVPVLMPLLKDSNLEVAQAAVFALGRIGSIESAQALSQFLPQAASPLRPVLADACLACAEQLLRDNHKREAQALYRALLDSQPPALIQNAAERGLKLAA
jgi:HEAT repeat protein